MHPSRLHRYAHRLRVSMHSAPESTSFTPASASLWGGESARLCFRPAQLGGSRAGSGWVGSAGTVASAMYIDHL